MLISETELQVIERDTDFKKIYIGPSRFTDDMWDLRQLITTKTTGDSQKIIRFGYITNPEMKQIIKLYAYYKLGKIKPQTVYYYINGKLPIFMEYCSIYGIRSFRNITKADFLDFSIWMKDVKKVAASTGFQVSHIIEEIINVGQVKGWDVPQTNILSGVSSHMIWDPKKTLRANKVKPIPEDIFAKILYHAIHDEKNILTKAGIIIQSQTGIRINEVLSIQEGCIQKTVDGDYYMGCYLQKTEKGEPIHHKVFVNELVMNVVKELSNFTEPLRRESGLKELFLIRHRDIQVLKVESWNFRISRYIKRWDIHNNKGELYHLTSHQFRATFVRELIKRKVPIAQIMKQYSHVSIEMTAHYLTLSQEEIKDIYSDMILSPDSKIAGIRAKEVKDKLNDMFRGKTENEIDDIISDLASTMSFNPLPTGVCLYDFRRGSCTDGDGCFFYNCPNYITEARFYPILKRELELLEKELKRLKELGQEPAWQVQYVKYQYLRPLVESLEVEINEKSV